MRSGAGHVCQRQRASSCFVLHGLLCEAIAIGDCELVHRRAPFLRGAFQVGGDVAKSQLGQHARRIVAGEVPARLDDPVQPLADALGCVRGADHAAHLGRKHKARNHADAGATLGDDHHGELLAPGAALEFAKVLCGRFGAGRRVGRLERRGGLFALLPVETHFELGAIE